jgi:hypothetical protein
MKLDSLVYLYRSMKDQKIDRYRFEYRHGHARFDVFFLIDVSPFILLFGAIGTRQSFTVAVKSDFQIDTILDKDTYKKLCSILDLKYDPNNRFSPQGFFVQFNQNVPHTASRKNKVEPHEIAPYRNISEEKDKTYFFGWRDNESRREHVSQENLEKTKDLIGYEIYLFCKSRNISSCWTDDYAKKKDVMFPEKRNDETTKYQ